MPAAASRSRAPARFFTTPAGLPRTPWTKRRRELDQALQQLALGEIVRAHPRRLEQLMGEEPVAAVVRGEAAAERTPAGRVGIGRYAFARPPWSIVASHGLLPWIGH